MATPARAISVPKTARGVIFSFKNQAESGSMKIGVSAINVEAMPTEVC